MKYLLRLLAVVDSSRIRLLLDIYHSQIQERKVVEVIRAAKDQIGYVHTIARIPPFSAGGRRKDKAVDKIRYSEMLPQEILVRRQKFPAAFIGLGGLEWHGDHQAVGLDALKAETLCERAAARSGGFAFPTLWYGEPRVHRLMEFTFDRNSAIKGRMGFKPEKFIDTYFGTTGQQQIEFYQALLWHLLIQMNTLEMKAVCLFGGHGPLRDFAQPVVERFNAAFHDTQAYAGHEVDYVPLETNPPSNAEVAAPYFRAPNVAEGGASDSPTREVWYREHVGTDHAAKWETAYLMYLRPDCVDMSVYLGRESEPLIGVNGLDPRTTATVEIGRKAAELIVAGMTTKAQELIQRVSDELDTH